MRELLLYVAMLTQDDPAAGAVKINKILFHADFAAYLELGQPITGHPYVHREYGPAPKDLRPIRKGLEVSKRAEVVQVDVGAPKPQDRIRPLAEADLTLFTAQELAIVRRVVKELWELRGMDLSEDSHRLPGWRATRDGELIPYQTAFIAREPDAADLSRGRELAAIHGWE